MKYFTQISLISKRRLPYGVISLFPKKISQQTCGENDNNQNGGYRYRYSNKIIIGTSLAALITYKLYDYRQSLVCAQQQLIIDDVGGARDGLPYYTLQEVSQHTEKDKRIWVTYKQGVYDITDFVLNHPGGDQILLAAGSSVEPFWVLYAVHNNPHVLNILETLRVGNLSKEESEQALDNMSDPYSSDPKRHPALKPASVKPFNAETPPSLLVEHFITPNELFYVRNHLPVPQIDAETYELEVEIEGNSETLILRLDDLKKLPKHTITATIMCAGNRRSDMTKVKPVKGLNWGPAAVGNAKWTGVRLRDVLVKAGLTLVDTDTKLQHVQFEGIDFDATGKTYGASIPLWKAVDPKCDVLLAFEMNGVPIPKDHGYPVRVVVPGVVGARNVKWLGKIVVSEAESDSHWQQNDYKGFSPSTDYDNADFTKSPAIQELPVISAICKPSPGDTVKADNGYIFAKGYAWSGGGQQIIRVDVTADGGKTWYVADLEQDSVKPPRHWSWTLWSVQIPVKPGVGEVELWAKAVDSCYNSQPENFENIWNFRGVLSNAYHRITINLE